MKKFHLKAFTLVEMLIVIVIIGILIAALLPRLQGAQNMARDTARQTALSQLQSAIVAYQSQTGRWPLVNSGANNATGTNNLAMLISDGIMSAIPADPNLSNEVSGLGTSKGEGEFLYLVGMKNSISNGGFVLMARTETPGRSNWVVSSGATNISGGLIKDSNDLAKIVPCKEISIDTSPTASVVTNTGNCTATGPADLRYILIY